MDDSADALAAGAPSVSLASWEFDEEIHAADRLIRSLGSRRAGSEHPLGEGHLSPTATPAKGAARPKPPRPRRKGTSVASALFSWTLLSLGLMAFVFGAVLLSWSFLADRVDLWRIGMPFTLGGQAALVLGLVFQLDGLWRNNRSANETLDELDDQISELRHATTLLTSSQSQSAQSFYLHLAERASPHLLLADLKGQLDMLAVRMAEERNYE